MARRKREAADANKLSHIRELAASWKRERPDIDHAELLLQIYIMRLGRMLDSAYDRMCRSEFGIGGAEMRVLFALRRAGPPYSRRPTDLFRALLVTSGAMTKQVDRLVASGHVVRLPDPKVGGGAQVKLTEKGLRDADAAITNLASRSLMARATEAMNKAEVEGLRQSVEDLIFALETPPAAPPAQS